MSEFPAITQTTLPLCDYPPYRVLPEELAPLLESLRVKDVTAVHYKCTRDYHMAPRRIGDDMFYFIVAGCGEVEVEGRVTKVKPGDTAHFARGVEHAATADPRDPFDVIAFHYDAMVFDSLTIAQLLHFPDVATVGVAGAFNEMIRICCREYALRPAGWQRGIESLALRLLLFYIREHLPIEEIIKSDRWREVRRVVPALEIMRAQLSRPISVEELSRACHLSEPQFRRVFARAMGASPNEYLRRRRMEEAALLLRRGEDTIEAVARRVGYSDPSFFAHSFKATMGTSPGKYRTLSAV